MKTIVKYFFLTAMTTILASCSKDVTVNIPPAPQQIVVEGHVEPGQYAYLYLSHNFAFFGTTTINTILQQDVVHGAKIAITDGITTDTMREVIPQLGYYQSLNMTGVTGRTYSLTVVSNGQTLTAS